MWLTNLSILRLSAEFNYFYPTIYYRHSVLRLSAVSCVILTAGVMSFALICSCFSAAWWPRDPPMLSACDETCCNFRRLTAFRTPARHFRMRAPLTDGARPISDRWILRWSLRKEHTICFVSVTSYANMQVDAVSGSDCSCAAYPADDRPMSGCPELCSVRN